MVGQDVRCSDTNHTQPDICDTLAGRYPKDFVFTGWHPFCRCYVVPVLKTEEEVDADMQRILRGEDPLPPSQSENAVEDVPDNFADWVRENEERIAAATDRGTLPYFIKDNEKYMDVHNYHRATETPLNGIAESFLKNYEEIETALGINRGAPMSFEEANEMRANPNYKTAVEFRQNCSGTVFANELRRRGFDVEAFGNSKEEWRITTILSKRPEIAFMDADGNPPVPIRIKTSGNLMRDLGSQMTEPGRYHLRFRFNNDSGTGHIITAERLADGTLRIYDPQNGKIIRNFREYSTGVTNSTFEYYRVDNLRINPDVARGAVKPSGVMGDAPKMKLPQIAHLIDRGWYGEFDPNISELRRQTLNSNYFTMSDQPLAYENLRTGKLLLKRKPLRRIINHCINADEIDAVKFIWNNPGSLREIRISPLGEGKDLTLESVQTNLRNKRARGVVEYIIYEFEYNGLVWTLKTEHHRYGFEQFYHLRKSNE